MSSETILSSLIGFLSGSIVTWIVAWYYYKKAGDELLRESKKLKETSDLILYKLHNQDTATEIKRNEKGEVVGLYADIAAKM
jgi:hypothetical protein